MIDEVDYTSIGKYLIYALVDPRDKLVRYIGMTNNIYTRMVFHLRDAGKRTIKGMWLEELQREGLQPIVKILEEIEATEAQYRKALERERYWIKEFERLGVSLINIQQNSLAQKISFPRGRSPLNKTPNEKNSRSTGMLNQNQVRSGSRKEEYLSAEDVARKLRVNIKRVYQWIKDGRLKATNIGTERRPNYRITSKALQDFLDRGDMS